MRNNRQDKRMIKNKFINKFLFINLVIFSSAMVSEISQSQKEMLESLPPDQRDSIQRKMEEAQNLQDELDEIFQDKPSTIKRSDEYDSLEEKYICEECIFGYEYFNESPTTFAPNSGTPVPSNYVLGPGDKILISYSGNEEQRKENFVSREGQLNLPKLGPINVTGLTFMQAVEYIENKVASELIGTKVAISLIDVRSINVYMLGEAFQPGVYTMSGLSTVSSALFTAGGVNESGSLRDIQVRRGGEVIAKYDFYDFLLSGSTENEIKLANGDIIFIPFIKNTVKVGGAFRRPYLYEFKEGETINDAVSFAGGFKSEVEPLVIELNTISASSQEREVLNIPNNEKQLRRLLVNGDMINTSSKSGIVSESITLTGQFVNPGEFSIIPGDTILDVIQRAGGYNDIAFSEGAVFYRDSVAESQKFAFNRTADDLERTIVEIITKGAIPDITEFTLAPISILIERLRKEEPLGRMTVNVDLLALKTDPFKNFRVEDGDVLHIPKRPNSISVVGEVLYASTLSYESKLGVDDYISLSGGLSESADSSRIFVIQPDGKSKIVKRSLFNSNNALLPGSTIVVSRDSRPFDAVSLTQIITPVLADLATSAAAIAALND